jgi:dihydroorotate dehydrogenase (NAD+) catalytic subunit
MADLKVDIGGLQLSNPVITASGTYGVGREYGELIDIKKLGAVCAKTITLKRMVGNRPPRLCETPAGMLNSIGLQNDGVEAFIAKDLPFLAGLGVPVIVSIAGNTVDDCAKLAKMVGPLPEVDAVELNISCPNVKAGGALFGSSESLAAEVVAKTRLATSKPLIVKLTPNVGDIAAIARACERAGADALSLINTVRGMAIDINTRRPRLGAIVGGLSGPAIKPIAVRMVWEVAGETSLPIIGMGGIASAEDALEFIIAGASAVAVGTANFVDPRAPLRVIEGIDSYLDTRGIGDIRQLTGSLVLEQND